MVGSLGAPLVPAIAQHEGVSLEAAQWSLTATLLVAAVGTPVIGRLGSGQHRRAVMLVSASLVTLGALLAALPLGFAALVVGRALQGLAFALSALSMAVARDRLPPARLRRALAAISMTNVTSAGLGFPVAALAADWFGVKGAFAFGGLLSAAALCLGLLTVPRQGGPPGSSHVDWMGAALFGSGALLLLMGAGRQGVDGAEPVLALLVPAAGVLLLGVSGWWMLRGTRAPLVDLRLSSRPGPRAAHAAALVTGLGMYLMLATVMVLVQSGSTGGYGLARSVTVAGLMLVPYALASLVSLWVVGRLAERWKVGMLLPLGAGILVVANLALGVWHTEVWQLVAVMAVGGLGSSVTFQAVPLLVVRDVPASETGSVMSFNIVLRFLGFALGSALALAILGRSAVDGLPTESGFVTVAWAGAAVSGVATLGGLLLDTRVRQAGRCPRVRAVRRAAAQRRPRARSGSRRTAG